MRKHKLDRFFRQKGESVAAMAVAMIKTTATAAVVSKKGKKK